MAHTEEEKRKTRNVGYKAQQFWRIVHFCLITPKNDKSAGLVYWSQNAFHTQLSLEKYFAPI